MSAVSRYLSRLYYGTKPTVLADGQQQIAVKVRVFDVNGVPLAGHRVTLVADVAGVTIDQPFLTNSQGYCVGLISSITPGEVNISAYVSSDVESSSDAA